MSRDPQLTSQTVKVLAALIDVGAATLSGAEIGRKTGLASGSLYPILLRLEKARWLESVWEAGDPVELCRPRRRYYSATALGTAKLRAYVAPLVGTIGGAAWA